MTAVKVTGMLVARAGAVDGFGRGGSSGLEGVFVAIGVGRRRQVLFVDDGLRVLTKVFERVLMATRVGREVDFVVERGGKRT